MELCVAVHLQGTSQKITYGPADGHKVLNTYTKGGFFCVLFLKGETGTVHKYPMESVWRVEETYEGSARKNMEELARDLMGKDTT